MGTMVIIKPKMMFFAASVLAAGLAGSAIGEDFDAAAGEFHFDGESIELHLQNKGVHPKVLVDLGDGKSNAFIVDTGASVNVIDRKIAEDNGYEIVGETEIGAPGGKQIPGNIVRIPLAHIGDAIVKDAEFVTMDLHTFSRGQMQGVLSLRLFDDYLLSYDLAGGKIIVSTGALSADDAAVQTYKSVSAHLSIDIDVAGNIVPSHIDTGSMGGFMLPAELKDSLPLAESPKSTGYANLVGGPRQIEFAKLDGAVTFAGETYNNPNIAFMDPSPGAGNIGGQVLSDFIMTIDQRNELIKFQKTAVKKRVATGNAPRQVGMMFQGMSGGGPMTLASVVPGSIAEKAGLQSGDVLIALNDKLLEQYDMQELGTLFRGSTALKLDVERDGETMIVNIQ